MSRYCHECAESDVNYIYLQSNYNPIVVSKYKLLMEAIKIYIKHFSSSKLISNFEILNSLRVEIYSLKIYVF